jgi:rhodanese-related sulfurtransferase
VLLAYLGYRFWERRRFQRALEMARISVAELNERLRSDSPPLIIDVRLGGAQGLDRQRIPGALLMPLAEVAGQVSRLPRDRDIILYCNCPNEASAAQAAKQLMRAGLERVRPLRGGLDAWVAAGYEVEPLTAAPGGPLPIAALPSAST